MRVVWCWRCKVEIPMLDDDEWAVVRLTLARQGLGFADDGPFVIVQHRDLHLAPPAPDDAHQVVPGASA